MMTPLPTTEILGSMENDSQATQSFRIVKSNKVDNLKTTKVNTVENLDLFNFTGRLKTFEKWPIPSVNKYDLAAAGFYFTGVKDQVKCPCCCIGLGHWKPGDNPLADHRHHSPFCKIVKEIAADSLAKEEENSSLGEDTCGPYVFSNDSSSVESVARESFLQKMKLNSSDKPLFPNYGSNEERLRTFENWPSSSGIPPDVLSMAGFVYSQVSDRTFCFHCGLDLHVWDDNDDPWIEHAHWNPNCKFVLAMRGKKFIENARAKKHDDLERTSEEMRNVVEMIRKANEGNVVDFTSQRKRGKGHTESLSSSSSSSSHTDEGMFNCLICLTEKRNTVLLPCYHVVGCAKCVNQLRNCCVCRQPIIYRRRLYFS